MVTVTPDGHPSTQKVTDEQYAQAQTRHNSLAAAGTLTDDQLASLDPAPTAESIATGLLAYSGQQRWTIAQGGITVNGVPMGTDDATRQTLTSAVVLAQTDSTITVDWKLQDGSFVQLTAAQIIGLGKAVAGFVQACFSAESTLATGINATPPTITTKAQIDAAYAAIPKTITTNGGTP
jgi:hypothetical protein